MSFIRKFFIKKNNNSKQTMTSNKQEYIICSNCGAGYNTQMIASSILMKSPFMADMSSWTTKIICSSCRSEFWVSGSYNKAYGEQISGEKNKYTGFLS